MSTPNESKNSASYFSIRTEIVVWVGDVKDSVLDQKLVGSRPAETVLPGVVNID